MKTKSKCALATFVGASLTRADIAALLVAYYGAVALDQVRASELCQKCRQYKDDKEECKRYREDHLVQIMRLLDTVSFVSQEVLAKLTVLAATGNPTVVRKLLIELLEIGALAYHADEPRYDAPGFFTALVKQGEADQSVRAPKNGEDTVKRMMRWLNPVDLLGRSRECGYAKSMPPKIWTWNGTC